MKPRQIKKRCLNCNKTFKESDVKTVVIGFGIGELQNLVREMLEHLEAALLLADKLAAYELEYEQSEE